MPIWHGPGAFWPPGGYLGPVALTSRMVGQIRTFSTLGLLHLAEVASGSSEAVRRAGRPFQMAETRGFWPPGKSPAACTRTTPQRVHRL